MVNKSLGSICEDSAVIVFYQNLKQMASYVNILTNHNRNQKVILCFFTRQLPKYEGENKKCM